MINETNMTNANNIFEMLLAVNQAGHGVLAALLLTILFIVFLIVFKNHDTKAVFLIDSFFTTIIAIAFWSIGLIHYAIILMPLALLVGSIIAFVFSQ